MNELISREDALNAMDALYREDCKMYGASTPDCFDKERANEAIRDLPIKQRWHLTYDDGFPPEGEQVLVSDGKHMWIDESECFDIGGDGTHIMCWASDTFCWENTAWMPLPDPPIQGKLKDGHFHSADRRGVRFH